MGRGELCPFYQPIVRLSTGALSGFEALVRWKHPRRGLLMPDLFLPLCEEMGLMEELGAMMMRDSAKQLAVWRQKHLAAGELTVAVNLSTGEIDRPDLIAEEKRVIWKAVFEKDLPVLQRSLADDFLDVSDVGVFTKKSTIDLVPTLTIKDYKLDGFQVISPSKDTAIVTYEAIQHWMIDGREAPSHVRASSVWARRGGQWRVVFHQESTLPPDAPPSK